LKRRKLGTKDGFQGKKEKSSLGLERKMEQVFRAPIDTGPDGGKKTGARHTEERNRKVAGKRIALHRAKSGFSNNGLS